MQVIGLMEPTYAQPRKSTATIQMAHYTPHPVTRDPLIIENSRNPTTSHPHPKKKTKVKREGKRVQGGK